MINNRIATLKEEALKVLRPLLRDEKWYVKSEEPLLKYSSIKSSVEIPSTYLRRPWRACLQPDRLLLFSLPIKLAI